MKKKEKKIEIARPEKKINKKNEKFGAPFELVYLRRRGGCEFKIEQ